MTQDNLYVADGSGRTSAGWPLLAHVDRQKVSSVSRMQTGKRLVIGGFLIAIAGIVVYCVAGFSADFGQELSTAGRAGLAMVAAGTISWFVGAIKYFHGAIDSDLPEDQFF